MMHASDGGQSQEEKELSSILRKKKKTLLILKIIEKAPGDDEGLHLQLNKN